MKRLDSASFDGHKAARDENKSVSIQSSPPIFKADLVTEKTRYTNPVKSKFRAKRLAAESTSVIAYSYP